ncbi:Cu(I)-responsive transcriptional regulator [Palleronia aestuarii]|uniref:Cu(I)-responsive transcriptional regulator n=1 Tax=Palleronia aestuarii TaxID=568105 RepID=A0A2W7PSN8_9RHOB|nr:MerR family DNA-binding protein [Palleronia aestuarii]PZX12469.1 Cu(I)-responsive transcriptional regulator [Palleronia aestuarii]
MNIGAAAERTCLPPKTIRYYEDIGLVAAPRDANGYRAFGAAELHKLAFLGRARTLGFTIEDCRTLLALWEDKRRSSENVKRVAEVHLKAIEQKIAMLQSLKQTLSDLVENCAGDERPECPILDDLAGKRI